jgi:hypothetical protein
MEREGEKEKINLHFNGCLIYPFQLRDRRILGE